MSGRPDGHRSGRRPGGHSEGESRSARESRDVRSHREAGPDRGGRERERDRDRPGDRHREPRRDDAPRTSRGGDMPLPPPPPLRGRDGGRYQRSTSPQAAQERDGEENRGTPGSGRKKPVSVSNPLMAELLKQGKLLASSSRAAEDTGSAGDVSEEREAGEISEEGQVKVEPDSSTAQTAPAGRKRKHSPIVWQPGGSKAARTDASTEAGSGPLGLLERAQQEAAALRQMQADLDPDAPAAMKGSPVLSDEEPDDLLGAGRAREGAGEDGLEDGQKRKGVSRWAVMEDEEPLVGDAAGQVPGSSSPGPEVSQGVSKGARSVPPGVEDTEGSVSDSDSEDNEPVTEALGDALPPQLRYDMKRECRDVNLFERINKISEGTYGVVYKAREKSTGRIVALKRVKMEHEQNGFPITSVREINILLNFHHPNIVNVEEVVVHPRDASQIYMVMEYADHDLKSLMDDKKKYSQPFSAGQVKNLMRQLLSGIEFLHSNWVLHRDLKTSNILYNGKGELKLCDFGMARQYGDPLGTYTHNVITLWYRCPELLFGQEEYSTAVDMWSVGCIMGEILTGKPLMPGQGELDQIDKMVQLLGTPTEEEWPDLVKLPNWGKVNLKQMPSQLRQRFTASTAFSSGTTLTEAGFDLLSRFLAWDPKKRITAKEALEHRWFKEVPLPVDSVLMPTFAQRKAG